MLQVHKIILWSNASVEEFEVVVNRTYAILMALKGFGAELSPNYLTAMRKENVKTFDYTLKSFKDILRNGVNKEGNTEFPDLGYTVNLFSSLANKESASISMTVGVKSSRFNNTLVVKLPQTLPIYINTIVVEKLVDIFKKCVKIFNPFWGCIGNSVNADRYNGYWRNSLPTAIHWINYFGENIVKQIGFKKVVQSPVYSIEALSKGYLICLKELPIDDFSEEDIKIQNNINKYFGFSK